MSYFPLLLRPEPADEEAPAPAVQHVVVYNPTLGGGGEDNAALLQQIVCFVADHEVCDDAKLNTVGLSRGLEAFGGEFATAADADGAVSVVKTLQLVVVVAAIEADFFLSCKARAAGDLAARQLVAAVQRACRMWRLLHGLLAAGYARDAELAQRRLAHYWRGFLRGYGAAVGYSGFLALVLPHSAKRASRHLDTAARSGVEHAAAASGARAVLVACFDRLAPQNYGLLHTDGAVATADLHVLYRWLELHDQYDKLDATHLTAGLADLYLAPRPVAPAAPAAPEPSAASTYLEMLSPVALTSGAATLGAAAGRWLARPSAATVVAPSAATAAPPSVESADPPAGDTGTFLVGLARKLVYLGDDECRLVVHASHSIVTALVYGAADARLDDARFYERLEAHLEPVAAEVARCALGSVSLLRDEPEDFYFVVHDPAAETVRSSLPYIPPTAPRPRWAGLHNLLADVFLVQGGHEFFRHGAMREYFHKFNGATTDWMFYYIEHHAKYIIIVKSHSARARRRAAAPATPDGSLLASITDYASLGFLDSLGDDVKLWLEGLAAGDA